MKQSVAEQLEQLENQIQEEEFSLLLHRHAGKLSAEELEERSINRKLRELLFRFLRIGLLLELRGDARPIGLKEEWEKAARLLGELEGLSSRSPEVLSHCMDVAMLPDPRKRKQLLGQLDLFTRLHIRKEAPLHQNVVVIGRALIAVCLEIGRTEEAFRVAENLVALSEERNSGDADAHREVVVGALVDITDANHSLAVKICKAQSRYFQNPADSLVCEFSWLYAFSAAQTEPKEVYLPLMEACHRLCLQVEGESSWLAARSGSILHCNRLVSDHSEESEAYLWETLRRIDTHFYPDMDETAEDTAAVTRSILLSWHLGRQTLRGLLPEILRLLDYCKAHEATNLNINLTVHSAENLLAGYYLETGDYLQAAEHIKIALQSVSPTGLPKFPSDWLLYSNLLLCYINLNDADRMLECIETLEALEPEYIDNEKEHSRILLLINTAIQRINQDGLDPDYCREIIVAFSDEIRNGSPDSGSVEQALWMLDLCSCLINSRSISRRELLRVRQLVLYFLARPQQYSFNNRQKVMVYFVLIQAEVQLSAPEALEHLATCLSLVKDLPRFTDTRIAILQFSIYAYKHYGKLDQALALVSVVLGDITAAWQKTTAYLNDHRIQQQLAFTQQHFRTCYALMRDAYSAEKLYEQILRFKDLPALAGRERNRLLRLTPVDSRLRDQIFDLQDRLAAAEMNDSLRGTSTANDLAGQLEQLEAAFAAQFPQNLQFTPIHFRDVARKLPEGAAIVEYYFAAEENNPGENADLVLDIFITRRQRGEVSLHHLPLHFGDEQDQQIAEYLSLLEDPEDATSGGQISRLSKSLYTTLLAPVMPYLQGVSQLYLAPDLHLCCLPLEFLLAGGRLQRDCQICRIVSGRDLLFYDDSSPAGGSFILGDPNYDCLQGSSLPPSSKREQIPKNPVSALPFSGVEAELVASYCGVTACRGNEATKYALRKALPCRIIHLATHGIMDESLDADALYASHLVFAGYNRWVTRHEESSFCGNGVLTADEISRMDLRQTELVVLSACQSGLGDTSYGSVRGLLSAFAAAGARWIVSHIWNANDFATSILMDVFYEAYLEQGMEVPAALQYAKDYLRTATVSRLRADGWFRLPQDSRIDPSFRANLERLETSPGYMRPFADARFWGGFTAHKAR